jgi:hypothetical protein
VRCNHGKTDAFLKIASALEAEGLAWFTRSGETGDDGVIYFRILSYEPIDSAKAFHHAQETEAALRAARIWSQYDMDRQSYQVRMNVPGIYKDGAK